MPENLEVLVKEDGVWLRFNASNGKSATISADDISCFCGPIAASAITQWCEDRKRDV